MNTETTPLSKRQQRAKQATERRAQRFSNWSDRIKVMLRLGCSNDDIRSTLTRDVVLLLKQKPQEKTEIYQHLNEFVSYLNKNHDTP